MSEFDQREFWEQREQDLIRAVEYCQKQLGEIALKEMGQMALPIKIERES